MSGADTSLFDESGLCGERSEPFAEGEARGERGEGRGRLASGASEGAKPHKKKYKTYRVYEKPLTS